MGGGLYGGGAVGWAVRLCESSSGGTYPVFELKGAGYGVDLV